MRRRSGRAGTGSAGDGSAEDRRRRFEDLVTADSAALLGYVRRRVDQPSDAADVVCDVFLVAWRRIDEVPHGRNGTLWLYGVARRTLANSRRGDERRAALNEKLRLQREIERVEPPESSASERVHEALARMSAIDREVLSLSTWEELTPTEIGEMTGLTPGAVRVRLHRARRRLKEMLESDTAVTPPSAVGHVWTRQATAYPGMEEGK